MSRIRAAYFANGNQPSLGVASLLRRPGITGILLALKQGPSTPGELGGEAVRHFLRQLSRADLITGYTIAGVTKYKLRRLPPRVVAVLRECELGKAA